MSAVEPKEETGRQHRRRKRRHSPYRRLIEYFEKHQGVEQAVVILLVLTAAIVIGVVIAQNAGVLHGTRMV